MGFEGEKALSVLLKVGQDNLKAAIAMLSTPSLDVLTFNSEDSEEDSEKEEKKSAEEVRPVLTKLT